MYPFTNVKFCKICKEVWLDIFLNPKLDLKWCHPYQTWCRSLCVGQTAMLNWVMMLKSGWWYSRYFTEHTLTVTFPQEDLPRCFRPTWWNKWAQTSCSGPWRSSAPALIKIQPQFWSMQGMKFSYVKRFGINSSKNLFRTSRLDLCAQQVIRGHSISAWLIGLLALTWDLVHFPFNLHPPASCLLS